jgi:hypothetical protein
MFHLKDGLLFSRLQDGAVKIIKQNEAGDTIFKQTIPADSWVSVITHMSKTGETSGNFEDAKKFHNK